MRVLFSTRGIVGYNSISVSQLSRQYVCVPISAQTIAGLPDNPTGDTVQMAFMPQPTQVPQLADWQTAVWASRTTDVLNPYAACCLVGPGGTIQLGIGTYVMYVKITDSPEVPVIRASMQLEIY